MAELAPHTGPFDCKILADPYDCMLFHSVMKTSMYKLATVSQPGTVQGTLYIYANCFNPIIIL